jgi:tetratricopeptide (TPR) repeat protein
MRFVIAVLGVLLCLFLIQATARVGFSRLLGRYAQATNSIPAADEAVRVSRSDANAHRGRAAVLGHFRMHAEAVKSLESAVSLRYRDDYLWLELGNAREEIGDTDGALAAFDQSVRWAPYYAHTHWQRGNLLLRMGRTVEAFAELRTATDANSSYLLSLIDLAWGISGGDLKKTLQLTDLRHDESRTTADDERLALLGFLARKGKGKELIEQARTLSRPLDEDQKQKLVRLLFGAKAFRDAFELSFADAKLPVPALVNGDFEEPFIVNDAGFGWVLAPEQSRPKLTIDVFDKFGGGNSLRINLDNNWSPGTTFLSQTVIVEAGKTYPMSFAVETKDLVTGGPPFITVSDASTNQLLGKSENLPTATSPWQQFNFEFTTLATSEAAVIRLQRNSCNSSPCPIFGTLWLDEFKIGPWKQAEH